MIIKMDSPTKKRKREIDLHFEVLGVVISRPEFKGVKVSDEWIADFVGLTRSAINLTAKKAMNKIRKKLNSEDYFGA